MSNVDDAMLPLDPAEGVAAVDALVDALDRLDKSLVDHERLMLRSLLFAAMDPIERMRWRRPDLLNDAEERVVDRLQRGG